MMITNIDKKLAKLGFIKVEEDKEYIVRYERKEKQGFIHCLDIVHKANGGHLIQSYQKDTNQEGFNNMCGLTTEETTLALMKLRKMKWKKK